MTKKIQVTNDEKARGLLRSIPLFGLRPSLVIFTAARFALVLLIALPLSCSSKRIAKANVDQVIDGAGVLQLRFTRSQGCCGEFIFRWEERGCEGGRE